MALFKKPLLEEKHNESKAVDAFIIKLGTFGKKLKETAASINPHKTGFAAFKAFIIENLFKPDLSDENFKMVEEVQQDEKKDELRTHFDTMAKLVEESGNINPEFSDDQYKKLQENMNKISDAILALQASMKAAGTLTPKNAKTVQDYLVQPNEDMRAFFRIPAKGMSLNG
jgi:uncharacterized membrane-anchored protein YhcB (DUF1043 family)